MSGPVGVESGHGWGGSPDLPDSWLEVGECRGRIEEGDLSRTEFGFERTSCDCWKCTRFCKIYPGYMIPADLPRMMEQAGYTDPWAYANDFLEASLGAIAVRQGIPFRVKTLRPACLPRTTTCIHFDENRHCRIHEVSPYGCAFVDDHMTQIQYDKLGRPGLESVLADRQNI